MKVVFNILERASKVNLRSFLPVLSKALVKALVTGGTGFVGSHLVDLLLKEGYAVRCLIRKTSDTKWLNDKNIEFVYGDVFAPEVLCDAVRDVEYVFHCAGLTKSKRREGYFQANATGTANLLEAVLETNAALKRFVHVSSQTAVGPSPSREPITEDVLPRPLTSYGKSKWEAEQRCRKMMDKLSITIVRPPAVYGPRDKDIFEFFNTMSKGLQPMVGFNEKLVSLIHVEDLVRGFFLAATSPKAAGQTYFISSKELYNWKQVGEAARKALNRKALRIRIPEFGVFTIAAVAEFFALFSSKPALINFEKARDMVQDFWTCDWKKAQRDFGFQQEIGLEDGIHSTIQWYRKHKWL